ncbi:hydrolase [Burkholderia phage BcepSauron]|uniref:Hydrolase n=1 Tax=Burkholderia phage BcepSauron TaxID=2530033 RepID=A0A482MLF3_9CAUD|nr:MutT/NUDIX hydrolase [Burkholderia phage BcepSauron]QBQ74479.1 hydrolase [Burkholderia phage BcepSauron]
MEAAYRLLTDIRDTEWLPPLVTSDPNYWGKVCAGCLIMAADTGRFLMPLRSEGVSDPNCWGTWGGAVDHGENVSQAVRREVQEEAGYRGPVKLMPLLVFRGHGMSYQNFLAIVPHEFEPTLNWETAQAVWVDEVSDVQPLHVGVKALLNDDPSMKTINFFRNLTPRYNSHEIEQDQQNTEQHSQV